LIIDRKRFGVCLRQRAADPQVHPFAGIRNATAIVIPQERALAMRADIAADDLVMVVDRLRETLAA